MGTGRTLNKAPRTRPRKTPIERNRREATHRKRLVALGMAEEVVAKLDSMKMRQLLRHPCKVSA